jgi:metal-responsive CopG/Arc/MetJ family transcriptional regulator
MTRKVAISVPDDLLAKVDAESRLSRVSRSRLFGMAAASFLGARRRQREVERYVRSYREHPETDQELTSTEAFLREAWAAEDDG